MDLQQWALKQMRLALDKYGKTIEGHRIIGEIIKDFAQAANGQQIDALADLADELFFA